MGCPALTTEEVYRTYRDMVYRLAVARTGSGATADDVLQEVFLRYVRRHPAFADEEHRKAWLLKVTVNCCRSWHTSAWMRHTVPLDTDIVVQLQQHSEVYYAVLTLPPDSRTVIHLFYYEGYTVKEIADLLSLREPTVKTRLYRARQKLRDILTEGDL